MIKIYLITFRLVVLGFFRRNYYVFLILFCLLFGIVYPPLFFFGREFAKMIFEAPSVLIGILLGALVYTLWTGWFLGGLIKKSENQYLKVILARGNRATWGWAAWIALGIQMPLFCFLGTHFVHGLALDAAQSYFLPGAMLISWIGTAARLMSGMRRPKASFWEKWSLNLPNWGFESFLTLLTVKHLLRKHGLAILFTKPLSISLLLGVLTLFQADEGAGQIFHLPFLLLIVLHSIYPFWIFRSEDQQMPWVRGLPLPLARRFAQLILVYLILILPEILILLYHIVNFGHFPLIILDLVTGFTGILLLLHSLLYTARTDFLSYVKGVFGISFLLFIALLFKVSLSAIGGVLILVAGIVYFTQYYRWDPRVE